MLLHYGAYLLINIENGHVLAAGVLNNGFIHNTTPWTKIEVIASRKYRNGHGSLLLKHMANVAEGQTIFVYAMTDQLNNPQRGKILSKQPRRKASLGILYLSTQNMGFVLIWSFKKNMRSI